jgi:LmbE family N-acetylglucosaminyl deacetylase
MHRAKAARVTVDPHVVGRVGDDDRSAILSHQCGECRAIESAAAQETMATEHPQILDLADRRLRREFGQRIGWIVSLVRRILE